MARSNKKAPTGTPEKKKGRSAPPTPSLQPAKPFIRLIPLTMLTAVGLLGLKSVEIYQAGRSLHEELFVSSVIAQDTATPAATDATTAQAAPAAQQPAADTPEDFFESRDKGFSQRELDVLESLSERRAKIEQLERDLSLREKVLKATEARIDEKITEMNAMSTELKELLVTYDKEEDAKLSSLVKIYETMKPKDAARIFDEMDMNILLLVVDRMNERRVAPVLAAMSPQKAKNLTQELADQQKTRPQPDELLEDTPYSPPLF